MVFSVMPAAAARGNGEKEKAPAWLRGARSGGE
jgi:hypothetical protein